MHGPPADGRSNMNIFEKYLLFSEEIMDDFKIKKVDNFSENKSVKCYCNTCDKVMNQKIIKSIKIVWEENVIKYGVDGSSDYQIIECVGCDQLSFREEKYFSEDRDYDCDGTKVIQYPTPTIHHRKEYDFDDLPYNLETIYAEAIKCFNNNQYILCATGIRSILDGICNERKIKNGLVEKKDRNGKICLKKSGNLDGKINGLKDSEVITKSNAKALHELRFLGNKAIHELDIPSKNDLITAFDIVEHILIDIYDLPIKFKKLEKKRIEK